MAICYSEKDRTFTLQTRRSSYQIGVGSYGFLLHYHYGRPVESGESLSHLIRPVDRGFSGNPYDAGTDRTFSLDHLPMEYPVSGVGDYRIPALTVGNSNGSRALDLRYQSFEIVEGKYRLDGLPALYENEKGEAQTLILRLSDPVSKVDVALLYGVLEELDIITRACIVTNSGGNEIVLERAMSMSLDFLHGEFELLHFHGRHAMERMMERVPLMHGIQTVSSTRGISSHHHNPGIVLCDKNTDETQGDCYGINLIYSGNFSAQIERDQTDQVRVQMGIGSEGFRYLLGTGESFVMPEVVLSYSDRGLSALSHNFHRAYRGNLCRGKYKLEPRPVLINNWEATYFDYDSDKLLQIAEDSSGLGIDLFVLDDGWFGARDSDTRGLGDWTVNEKKLKGGLKPLVDKVNALGMKFGIWIEPEMVNEDSELYRQHADWVLQIPGRKPTRSRHQLVLDLSRDKVRSYLFKKITAVLDSANIEYVKWDMNRSISDWYSLPSSREEQGELPHRYVLGLYKLMEQLTSRYPDILFEGCSGGGGRFDPGMLYYQPQIWCSDNTDAVDRLFIQYGTSFFYPLSAIGAHVSAVPNHQTGRTEPMHTRGVVAMTGGFGYELDATKLTKSDKKVIREQIAHYKKHQMLISGGVYHRLISPYEGKGCTAWEFAAEDGSEALISAVFHGIHANGPNLHIPIRGLDPHRRYRLDDGTEYLGSTLLSGGVTLPRPEREYEAVQLYLQAI
ncbi:MAG: alpha-galactosidase [Oscillospiraceae bacterium]